MKEKLKERSKKSQYESSKKYNKKYNKLNINIQLDRSLITEVRNKLGNSTLKNYLEELIRKDLLK
jgi:hypothetical protein